MHKSSVFRECVSRQRSANEWVIGVQRMNRSLVWVLGHYSLSMKCVEWAAESLSVRQVGPLWVNILFFSKWRVGLATEEVTFLWLESLVSFNWKSVSCDWESTVWFLCLLAILLLVFASRVIKYCLSVFTSSNHFLNLCRVFVLVHVFVRVEWSLVTL